MKLLSYRHSLIVFTTSTLSFIDSTDQNDILTAIYTFNALQKQVKLTKTDFCLHTDDSQRAKQDRTH